MTRVSQILDLIETWGFCKDINGIYNYDYADKEKDDNRTNPCGEVAKEPIAVALGIGFRTRRVHQHDFNWHERGCRPLAVVVDEPTDRQAMISIEFNTW